MDVCSDERDDEWEAVAALASLVQKSLVAHDAFGTTSRYRLLESTREYTREKLVASGEADDLALRHLTSYARSIDDAGRLWDAMDDLAWQRAVADDLENVRVAFDWGICRPETARTAIVLLLAVRQLRLVVNLPEAICRLDAALARAERLGDIELIAGLRAKRAALVVYAGASAEKFVGAASDAHRTAVESGSTLWRLHATLTFAIARRAAGDFEGSSELLAQLMRDEALRAEPRLRAQAFADAGVTAFLQAGPVTAREHLAEAIRGSQPGSLVHATALASIAEVDASLADLDGARLAALAAKDEFAALGSALNVGVIGNNLAAYALALNDIDDALERLREALPILRGFGARAYMLQSIEHYALLAALVQQHDASMQLLGFTEFHFRRIGSPRIGVDQLGYERLIAILERDVEEHRRSALMRAGTLLDDDTALAQTRILHATHQRTAIAHDARRSHEGVQR